MERTPVAFRASFELLIECCFRLLLDLPASPSQHVQ